MHGHLSPKSQLKNQTEMVPLIENSFQPKFYLIYKMACSLTLILEQLYDLFDT